MAEPAKPAAPSVAQLKIDRSGSGAGAGRRRQRRWWPVVVGVLALAAAAGWWWAPRALPVQVTSVRTAFPTAQYVQLNASGYVVAQRRAAVASKATGRLVALNVREGSRVRQGELIARLDAADVQAALAAARAGVGQAQAGRQQAEAAWQQARVQQANADADFVRARGLVAQHFISAEALDSARARADGAAAATAAADAARAAAVATVAAARAQVQVQQVSLDSTEIRAPFDGVVLVKNANVGDLITPFSSAAGAQGAVVTMADMGTLEVEADVSETNVSAVHVGQPVEITLDALPEARFRGSVSGIVPTVERAKATVMTKVRFDQLDARILPEMSAKVSFLSRAATDADQRPVLAVNPKALDRAAGQRAGQPENDGAVRVWRVAADDTLQAVPVTVGRTLGDNVEVQAAELHSGDRLVLNPAPALRTGAHVTLVSSP